MMLATQAGAQSIPTLAPLPPDIAAQSSAEALAQDAGLYAQHYGVPLAEAVARLHAQEDSVPATDALAVEFHDRLAGISIEHSPAFRIVVLLTGDQSVADRLLSLDGRPVPVIFRAGAVATRERMLEAIDIYQDVIRAALIDPPGLGVDARSGQLLLAAGGDDADLVGLPELERQVGTLTGIPVHAFVPGRQSNFAAVGGGTLENIDRPQHRRYRCTAGFVVTDDRTTAIATAAHCPDDLDFLKPGGRDPLRMLGAWGARYQDVQIHAGDRPLLPLFAVGGSPPSLRSVATWRRRSSMRVGDFVCHQGISSGYSCAEVLMADYAPPGDLCAGPCPATWVAVAGPQCAHGDSGGPVFLGRTAFGLMKGGSYRPDGRCNFYFYMSTDYLPPGWTLLHDPGAR
jgi:hypothetical protein